MKISFDVISDLNISVDQKFDWHGKSSSLYCIVAGNISDDISIVNQVLSSLSSNYHCVLYIPGKLEFADTESVANRILEISILCKTFSNIVLLYNHVCIVDGIAIIAVTADYGDLETSDYSLEQFDYDYLRLSVARLQKHKDVKKIACVTAKVPTIELYCGDIPEDMNDFVDFTSIKNIDTENKISHWIYSGSPDNNQQTIDDVTFVSNPNVTDPYYPVRVLI